MTRALVLSGGGSRGAFQVGVLRKLMRERKVDYPLMVGVSVGALNVAKLGQIPLDNPVDAFDTLEHLWLNLTSSKVRRKRTLGMLSAFSCHSVYDTRPLRRLVQRELDLSALRTSGRRVVVGAVSWESGQYRAVDQHQADDFALWVLASASYPVFFEPVEIEGQMWADGGVRNVAPIGEAIRRGATSIDVVMASNPDLGVQWRGRKAVPDYMARAIELQGDEVIRTDLQAAGVRNELARLTERYRDVYIRVFEPSRLLDEAEALDFEHEAMVSWMDHGYRVAEKRLKSEEDIYEG